MKPTARDNIPISLCRSTMVMRIDNGVPKFYQPLTRRCVTPEPCVQVRLPQAPKPIFTYKPNTHIALYGMLAASVFVFAWLALTVIISTHAPF